MSNRLQLVCQRAAVLLACGLIAIPTAMAFAANLPDSPNVLFIAVDDLRPELGCYGAEHIHSPNIDRLASEGLVFGRAYCQQAVCGPSRASLLSGLRPDTIKVTSNLEARTLRKLIGDTVTLPQHFKNHGYAAVGMGKIYHAPDSESWTQYVDVPWTDAHCVLPESIALREREREKYAVARRAQGLPPRQPPPHYYSPVTECADVPDNAYRDGQVADHAVEHLRELADQDQPFFLAVGFVKSHLAFGAPKRYWDLYDRNSIRLAVNPFHPTDAPSWSTNGGWELRQYSEVPHQPSRLEDDLARRLLHGYFACISYIDAQVGRVIGELERLGLRDNTVIVLWGDHGWHLGEHNRWGKNTNYEICTRVPLICSVPGMKASGRTTHALTEFVDIYPTLVDLCGLPQPQHQLAGRSFAPLLEDPEQPWKTAAFSQFFRTAGQTRPLSRPMTGYSLRNDRYRFVLWLDQEDATKVHSRELYDHTVDPQENTNIAHEPASQDLVAQLEKQLREGL